MPRIKGTMNLNMTLFAVAAALFVVAALCVSIVALVYSQEARNTATAATPASPGVAPSAAAFLDSASCCIYTHPDLPALVADLRAFRRAAILGNGPLGFENGPWSIFQTQAVDLETPFVNNTYLQGLVTLRTRTRAMLTANSDSLEDIQLRPYLNDLDLILNLTAIDAYFMQTGFAYRRNSWLSDPWSEASALLGVLQFRTAEPDFGVKVAAWLVQLDAKATRWFALAQRSLAAGKVHANLTLVRQYNMTSDGFVLSEGMYFALSGDYMNACVLANLNGTQATACFSAAASLETKLADLLAWWTDTYMPAAAALRPDSAPGLRNVTDGSEIYSILQRYHVGVARTDAALETLAAARYTELTAALATVAPAVLGAPGATMADFIVSYLDLSDTRFHACSTDRANATASFTNEVNHVRDAVFPATGSLTNVPVTIFAGGYTAYYAGLVNASTGVWTDPAQYYFYERRDCDSLNPLAVAFPVAEYRSIAASDIVPGRGLAQSGLLEIDCSFFHTFATPQEDLWQSFGPWRSGNAATLDGWAMFADYLTHEMLNAYRAVDAAASLYRRARSAVAMVNDVCLHATAVNVTCTVDEARARIAVFGLDSADYENELETLLSRPGFGLAAGSGEQLLREQRLQMLAGAPDSTTADFVKLFVRFGQPDVARDFARLVDVFVARANATVAVPATAFGADLIPLQFAASSGRPVVGVARDAACSLSSSSSSSSSSSPSAV